MYYGAKSGIWAKFQKLENSKFCKFSLAATRQNVKNLSACECRVNMAKHCAQILGRPIFSQIETWFRFVDGAQQANGRKLPVLRSLQAIRQRLNA